MELVEEKIEDTKIISEDAIEEKIKKSGYTESQKRASIKWQQKNSKEIYQKNKFRLNDWLELNNITKKEYMQKHYEENKEKYKIRNKEAYLKRKESKIIN